MADGTATSDSKRRALDVRDVAEALGCSTRHVWRMVETKRIPLPATLGRLKRWPRCVIERWFADGCPPMSGGQRR